MICLRTLIRKGLCGVIRWLKTVSTSVNQKIKSDVLISLRDLSADDEDKLADYEDAEESMLFRKALMAS